MGGSNSGRYVASKKQLADHTQSHATRKKLSRPGYRLSGSGLETGCTPDAQGDDRELKGPGPFCHEGNTTTDALEKLKPANDGRLQHSLDFSVCKSHPGTLTDMVSKY
jgi:hypothetical protein